MFDGLDILNAFFEMLGIKLRAESMLSGHSASTLKPHAHP
jgi:hypothetical protein